MRWNRVPLTFSFKNEAKSEENTGDQKVVA